MAQSEEFLPGQHVFFNGTECVIIGIQPNGGLLVKEDLDNTITHVINPKDVEQRK